MARRVGTSPGNDGTRFLPLVASYDTLGWDEPDGGAKWGSDILCILIPLPCRCIYLNITTYYLKTYCSCLLAISYCQLMDGIQCIPALERFV